MTMGIKCLAQGSYDGSGFEHTTSGVRTADSNHFTTASRRLEQASIVVIEEDRPVGDANDNDDGEAQKEGEGRAER